MTPTEYNRAHAATIARILATEYYIHKWLGKCGSAEMFVHELATIEIYRWRRSMRGRPPWQAGRRKSVGGRDQMRWRNACMLRRFKFADAAWDFVPKMKLLKSHKVLRYR